MLIVACDALWGDSQAFFCAESWSRPDALAAAGVPPAGGDKKQGFLARGRVRRFLFFAFTLHRVPICCSVSVRCV